MLVEDHSDEEKISNYKEIIDIMTQEMGLLRSQNQLGVDELQLLKENTRTRVVGMKEELNRKATEMGRVSILNSELELKLSLLNERYKKVTEINQELRGKIQEHGSIAANIEAYRLSAGESINSGQEGEVESLRRELEARVESL